MKKILFLMVAILSMYAVYAQDRFVIDSIEYSLAYPADSVVSVYKCHQTYGDVIIPETVSYYGRTYTVNTISGYAFYGKVANEYEYTDEYECKRIYSITLPNTIKNIGSSNFEYFPYLAEFTIPSSVEEIGDYSFNYCAGLRLVNLNNINHIKNNSFNHCPNLEKVTVFDGAFSGLSHSIGTECFSFDSALAEIVIGDDCRELGRDNFKCCPNIKKITIGAYLDWVGLTNFTDANPQDVLVDTVVVHGNNPPAFPFGPDTWTGLYGDIIDYHTTILVVPCNTRSIYEQADGWNQFYNIVEDCSTNSIHAVEQGCDIYIFSHDGRIVMHNENNACGVVYSIEGRVVETICDGTPSNPLPNGVYLVRVGTLPARKVVVIR